MLAPHGFVHGARAERRTQRGRPNARNGENGDMRLLNNRVATGMFLRNYRKVRGDCRNVPWNHLNVLGFCRFNSPARWWDRIPRLLGIFHIKVRAYAAIFGLKRAVFAHGSYLVNKTKTVSAVSIPI